MYTNTLQPLLSHHEAAIDQKLEEGKAIIGDFVQSHSGRCSVRSVVHRLRLLAWEMLHHVLMHSCVPGRIAWAGLSGASLDSC